MNPIKFSLLVTALTFALSAQAARPSAELRKTCAELGTIAQQLAGLKRSGVPIGQAVRIVQGGPPILLDLVQDAYALPVNPNPTLDARAVGRFADAAETLCLRGR